MKIEKRESKIKKPKQKLKFFVVSGRDLVQIVKNLNLLSFQF